MCSRGRNCSWPFLFQPLQLSCLLSSFVRLRFRAVMETNNAYCHDMPDAPRQLRVCTYYRRIIVENFVDRRETTTSYFVTFFRKIFPKFTKWDTSKYPSCSLYRDNLRNESRIIFKESGSRKQGRRKERKKKKINRE